ncbi:MAG: 3'-5' exonuclease [Candidatus Competibacterales bacterium]
MQWLQRWRRQRQRKRLRDESYAFLFDAPPKEEWVCFDCETTHLNPRRAELLSIGAVIIRQTQILTSQRLSLLIKPSGAIDQKSIVVHHLRHMDVHRGLAVDEAIERFVHFVGPRPLVGYYLEFDVAMIDKYLKPMLGIGLPNPRLEVSGLYYDKKQNRHQPRPIDLRFQSILRDLDLPTLGQHDAYNDALMTAMMFVKLNYGKSTR